MEHIPPTGIGRTRISAAFNQVAHIARKRVVPINGMEKRLGSVFKIVNGVFDNSKRDVGGHLDVSVFVEEERDQGVNLSLFLCEGIDEKLVGRVN